LAADVVSSEVLAADPAACRTARRFVRDALGGDGSRAVEMAELVVCELATNAVRHAGSTFTTQVLLSDETLRVAVTDATPVHAGWSGFPVRREHGLGIVAALARDWGVQPLDDGKTVWADMARAGA
jgi:hypothetical protein